VESVGQESIDHGPRHLDEYFIDLGRIYETHARDTDQPIGELSSQTVGVGRVPNPEPVGDERIELRRAVPHLAHEVSSAFPTVLGAGRRAYIEEDGGFSAHRAILRPAKRQGVDPGAPRGVGGVAAEPSDALASRAPSKWTRKPWSCARSASDWISAGV